ncbi:pre-mRNA-splicing factor CWC22 homolog, partial [Notothenia coriiceps]|uniref:Pre-mRNA-splicing factor CWC22 homolog n=1 Tax=Notothenia coriiceps TaxID=8208 RepID=A0A6I9PML5_9TELE
MDSPSRSPSPIPEMKEPSEDEASPAAEKPKQEGPIEKSPEPQTKPSREASPAARSRSGSPASGGPASGGPAPGGPASSSSDDSTSSDDEEEHQGALRRLRSSVAQIKRSKSKSRSRDRSISRDRDRSRSGEGERSGEGDRSRSKSRDRSRSRGRERSRSRDRDRGRYDRGRHDRDRYDVRRDDRDARFDRRPNRDAEWEQRRRGRSGSPSADREPGTAEEPPVKKKKEEIDPILTRTGGAYIPPAKLRMMQQQITDKTSLAYQRMSWEALKKSINGLINKVNVANIVFIIQELLQENIVRGRGLLARSMLQAQAASPIFTHVYSAVISIINSKFPQIGELILKRLILSFRRSYRRNIKQQCLTASKFVAHLINQNVAHEVLCLEMLTLLLERPTDDSVEVAIAFLKECGLKLTEVSPRGINAIFERLRNVLHESAIDKRVQYMIEVMFAIRKDGFKDHPVIPEGLDLVDEGDQFTHMLPLDDEYSIDDILNVFKMDPDFLENEEKYKTIKREILDEGSSDSGEDGDASGDDEDDEEENAEPTEEEKIIIYDQTEINLVAFRRTIYLAIQSSLDFEECAHKLIKMDFPDSQT